MKYNEIINKIKKFKIGLKYGKMTFDSKDSENLFETIKEEQKIMDDFLSELMVSEDLSIFHNEYSSTENLRKKCENLNRLDLEELILQKKVFLDKLKNDRDEIIYYPLSNDFFQKLVYEVSILIIELENIFNEMEVIKENPELTLTKKIALLKSLGFYDDIELLYGSNAFKAKITQLLTGGSLDAITKNIKNLDLDIKDIDAKYTSYTHVKDMKNLVSKIKSETRGK
ncbi:hypothetical protein N9941_02925 [Flavobacteriaceae bacterium]|nr:hypothetical protein [Flavobacteriaceae bacterium]